MCRPRLQSQQGNQRTLKQHPKHKDYPGKGWFSRTVLDSISWANPWTWNPQPLDRCAAHVPGGQVTTSLDASSTLSVNQAPKPWRGRKRLVTCYRWALYYVSLLPWYTQWPTEVGLSFSNHINETFDFFVFVSEVKVNGPLPKRCRSKLEYWRGRGGWVGETTVTVSPKNHNRILQVKTDHTLQGSNPYPQTLVTRPLAQNPPTLTKTEPLEAASCRNSA